MKKIKIYFLSLFAACSISLSASAFLLPPMPPTPVVDGSNDVIFFLNVAQTTIAKATAQANVFLQNLSLQAKSMLMSYVGKFKSYVGSIFNQNNKQELPGTVQIVEAKVADIYDPLSIQAAMYPLFFEYPANCEDTSKMENVEACEQYRQAATLLYQKTIIEVYTVVRELEKQFAELEQSIDDVEADLQEGKNGSENPNDGANAIAKNLYSAYTTMDAILKIIEEIAALRAQYIAAQSLGTFKVRPALPVEEKKAELNNSPYFVDNNIMVASSSVKHQTQISFASISNEEKKLSYKRQKFSGAPSSGLQSPFAGNEKDIAHMENLSQAYEHLKKAMEIHNIVQSLQGMSIVPDTYNKQKKLHQKSVEVLQTTEQCVIDYYSYMYEDAHQMWSGGLNLKYAPKHDFRTGLSAWVYKAYTMAKAEDTGMVLDADDFAESSYDTSDIEVDNIAEAQDKIASRIDTSSSGFKDDNKIAELNGAMKETELIVWNIGAEASKILAEDQKNSQKLANNKYKGKWGTVKTRYPLWKDVKNFYTQYIVEKYDSINRRLKIVNTNDLFLNVAEKISQISDNKQAIRNIRQLVKEQQREPTSNVNQLVAAKQAKLNELMQKRNNRLAENKRQDDNVVMKINNIQAQIDSLSTQLQDKSEQKAEAEKTIVAMEDLIESLLKSEEERVEEFQLKTNTIKYKKDINTMTIQQHSHNQYKTIYSNSQKLVNAQLVPSSELSSQNLGYLTGVKQETVQIPDIKIYEEQIITEEEVEYETPQSLHTAQYTLDENREKLKRLNEEISSINERIAQLKQEKKKYEEQRKIIAQEKEVINAEYAEEVHEQIVYFDTQIEQAEKQYIAELEKDSNIDFVAFYKNKSNKAKIIKDLDVKNFVDLLETTEDIVNIARSVAKEIVDGTRDNILSIDNLHDLSSNELSARLYDYHKDMIEKLKKLPEEALLSEDIIKDFNVFGIVNLVKNIYTSYMVNDACINDTCLLEKETTYFAGANGSRRDFLVPILPPKSNLPPPRDIVYFDFEYYNKIPKSKKGYVSKADVLNNLSYVPDIWKRILTSPAFVEKDIDLSSFLGDNNLKGSKEKLAFGGVFPCWYPSQQDTRYLIVWNGSKFIIYDPYKGNTIYQNLKTSKRYVGCQNLLVTGSGTKLTVKSVAESTEDNPLKSSASVKSFSDFYVQEAQSELGYLFEHDGKGLKFNSLAQTMFNALSNANKDDKPMTQKLVMYDVSSFVRNQIGEFLRASDSEQREQQNLDEVAIELQQNKEQLKEIFVELEPDESKRFIPSDDLDLSKDEDYNLVRTKLMNYKNEKLNQGKSLLTSVQGSTHEVIKDRLAKLNNMIKLMTKDKDAYVTLSDSMDAGAELDEKIKTEKANRQLSDKQKKDSDKAFEEALKQLGRVHCFQLIDNM